MFLLSHFTFPESLEIIAWNYKIIHTFLFTVLTNLFPIAGFFELCMIPVRFLIDPLILTFVLLRLEKFLKWNKRKRGKPFKWKS